MSRDRVKKCCKCSNTSKNSNKSFHRFLKPGKRNIYRAQLWAKWAFPNEDNWTTEKLLNLYNTHQCICSDHFSKDSYLEHKPQVLSIYSVPIGAIPPDHANRGRAFRKSSASKPSAVNNKTIQAIVIKPKSKESAWKLTDGLEFIKVKNMQEVRIIENKSEMMQVRKESVHVFKHSNFSVKSIDLISNNANSEVSHIKNTNTSVQISEQTGYCESPHIEISITSEGHRHLVNSEFAFCRNNSLQENEQTSEASHVENESVLVEEHRKNLVWENEQIITSKVPHVENDSVLMEERNQIINGKDTSIKSLDTSVQENEMAQLWAKWAFPNEDNWTPEKLRKLYCSHKWLCSGHFSEDSFFEHEPEALNRHCVPIGAIPPDHEDRAHAYWKSRKARDSKPSTVVNNHTIQAIVIKPKSKESGWKLTDGLGFMKVKNLKKARENESESEKTQIEKGSVDILKRFVSNDKSSNRVNPVVSHIESTSTSVHVSEQTVNDAHLHAENVTTSVEVHKQTLNKGVSSIKDVDTSVQENDVAQLWAKWAFPNEDNSATEKLTKLHTSGLLLCSGHFSKDSLIELNPHHLSRHCVPIGALPSDHAARTQAALLESATSKSSAVNNNDNEAIQAIVIKPKSRESALKLAEGLGLTELKHVKNNKKDKNASVDKHFKSVDSIHNKINPEVPHIENTKKSVQENEQIVNCKNLNSENVMEKQKQIGNSEVPSIKDSTTLVPESEVEILMVEQAFPSINSSTSKSFQELHRNGNTVDSSNFSEDLPCQNDLTGLRSVSTTTLPPDGRPIERGQATFESVVLSESSRLGTGSSNLTNKAVVLEVENESDNESGFENEMDFQHEDDEELMQIVSRQELSNLETRQIQTQVESGCKVADKTDGEIIELESEDELSQGVEEVEYVNVSECEGVSVDNRQEPEYLENQRHEATVDHRHINRMNELVYKVKEPFTEKKDNRRGNTNIRKMSSTTLEAKWKNQVGMLCRLCTKSDFNCIPIFRGKGKKLELGSKILKYFQMEVQPGDKLPDQVCPMCLEAICAWDEYVQKCVTAGEKLKELLLDEHGVTSMLKENKKSLGSEQNILVVTPEQNILVVTNQNSSAIQQNWTFNKSTVVKQTNPAYNKNIVVEQMSETNTENQNVHNNLVNNSASISETQNSSCNKTKQHPRVDSSEVFHDDEYTHNDENMEEANANNKEVDNWFIELFQEEGKKAYWCGECRLMFLDYRQCIVHYQTTHSSRKECKISDSGASEESPSLQEVNVSINTNNRQTDQLSKNANKENFNPKVSSDFKCDVCSTNFSNYVSLAAHKMAVHARHKCEYCSLTFSSSKDLRRHNIIKHTSLSERMQSKTCPVCHQQVETFHFKKHLESHPGLCTKCYKIFPDEKEFEEHKLVHLINYECSICGIVFNTATNLKYHLETHLPGSVTRPLNRPLTHTSKDKQYDVKCKKCGKLFTSRTGLTLHSRKDCTSTESRMCYICGLILRTSLEFQRHILKHKSKPFKCSYCDRSFRTETAKNTHTYKHTGERPYVCVSCDKRFLSKYHLLLHSTMHSNSKLFKCNFCDKTFQRKRNLSQHIQSHSSDKHYKCDLCGSVFIQYNHLKKHKQKHYKTLPCINAQC